MKNTEVVGSKFIVQTANENHFRFADIICAEMEESAKKRGTGIAKRSPVYIMEKMVEGKAIIATTETGEWVGFCYIETWEHGKFVANSGLIVHPDFRNSGMAKAIKQKAFELSRTKYPDAKIIGITTSLPVMKINSDLGYEPVTFSELPADDAFWKGCASCVNYDVLTRTGRKHCLCTGMMYNPDEKKKPEVEKTSWDFLKESSLYERWMRIKQRILLRREERAKKKNAGAVLVH
ncbi:GNAT family N-acetyltransferase [Dyadobacter sediminis]|uniref:GNAT family N-acetyltransferase n=1 Tax=Dyadobacter sediminis TaxID=1493691 RepID=A0A5R9K938_9BACT|nr:GNAT family N-acetyltransferase [Dyadobacter sediminis]TLU90500.1 GNAT family N-acetyltransferase [Dyadobacter sediminis]GGC08209.1 N-acetyltransferase [Dyadobacter sediminis]